MSKLWVVLGVIIMSVSGAPSNVQAQAAACQGPEYRQMDFWLGAWDLSWEPQGEDDTGKGTNDIVLILDDCVVEENFKDNNGFIGRSHSVYHALPELWRQTWVDNQGGYFALTGGPDDEGFKLEITRISDKAPYMRMIWRNVEQDSLDWHWQRSPDEGKTWEDAWHIHYERRKVE